MAKVDAVTVFVAFGFAAIVVTGGVLTSREMQQMTRLVSDTTSLTFFSIWTIGVLPIAFAMPRLRARFFGGVWRVPSHTYVLPRWIVHLCIGSMCGQVVGFSVLAILQDDRIFWLAGSSALIFVTLCPGAWRRLGTHPSAEFTMPWCRMKAL